MRKLRDGKIPILITLQPEQYRKLEEYAREHGNQTKTAIIRYAIQLFLSYKAK